MAIMEIKDRFLLLRKTLQLTQAELGAKLGISHAAVSKIESKKVVLTEQNVRLICSSFNVNEQWLRYGIGDMFMPGANTEKEKRLLAIFKQMSPSAQDLFLEYALKLLRIQQEMDAAVKKAGKENTEKP